MQNTFLVSYDLQAPEKNYQRIWEHLKTYPNWAKPLESLWIIQTDLSALGLAQAVAQNMDANDKLFVTEVTGLPAWKNLNQAVQNWINNNLT